VKEPVPIRSERLDERTWKRLLAASSPLVDSWPASWEGVIGIVEKLEPASLCAIEPENDSLAEFGRLVLMLELDPPLEIGKVRDARTWWAARFVNQCLSIRF
jgi:hypothetical protein